MTDVTLPGPFSPERVGADPKVDLCTSRRGTLREQHLTAAAETPVSAPGLARALEAVALRLARERIEPIAEKIYGASEAREAILAARREAFAARGLDASLPATFVSGTPACGGLLAGVHVWGVAQDGAKPVVQTVSAGPIAAARLWSGAGFGLFVELQEIYADGLVHVSSLQNDYYHFDASGHRLIGDRTRRVYRLGDRIRVRIARVDLDERKVDLLIDEDGAPEPARKRRQGETEARRPEGGERGRPGSRRRRR